MIRPPTNDWRQRFSWADGPEITGGGGQCVMERGRKSRNCRLKRQDQISSFGATKRENGGGVPDSCRLWNHQQHLSSPKDEAAGTASNKYRWRSGGGDGRKWCICDLSQQQGIPISSSITPSNPHRSRSFGRNPMSTRLNLQWPADSNRTKPTRA